MPRPRLNVATHVLLRDPATGQPLVDPGTPPRGQIDRAHRVHSGQRARKIAGSMPAARDVRGRVHLDGFSRARAAAWRRSPSVRASRRRQVGIAQHAAHEREPVAVQAAGCSATTASPARTRCGPHARSRSTTPTHVPMTSYAPGASKPGQLRGLAADEFAAGLDTAVRDAGDDLDGLVGIELSRSRCNRRTRAARPPRTRHRRRSSRRSPIPPYGAVRLCAAVRSSCRLCPSTARAPDACTRA